MRAQPSIWFTDTASLVMPCPEPLFLTPLGIRMREHSPLDDVMLGQWDALSEIFRARLTDGTETLTNRQFGAQRRRTLARQLSAEAFGRAAVRSRPFQTAQLRGEVVWCRDPHLANIQVALFVDGLPVQTIKIPFLIGLRARVFSDEFVADSRFETIEDGPALRAVRPETLAAANALGGLPCHGRQHAPPPRRRLGG